MALMCFAAWIPLCCVSAILIHQRVVRYMALLEQVEQRFDANRYELFARYGVCTWWKDQEARKYPFRVRNRIHGRVLYEIPVKNLESDSAATGVPAHALRKLASHQRRMGWMNFFTSLLALKVWLVGRVVVWLVMGQ